MGALTRMMGSARPAVAGMGADRIFRVLLVASILGPAFVFAGASWLTYRATVHETEQTLSRAVELAQEHALKVFETHQLLADQVDALMSDQDADDPASERAVHDELIRMTSRLPQAQTVWLLDGAGHALAAATSYPVPRDVDFSDRDYFQGLRDGPEDTYVSAVSVGRVDGRLFFNVARRLHRDRPGFNGVVAVSVPPGYFTAFYERLARDPGMAFGMLRDDGAFLARYPAATYPFPKLGPDSGFVKAIAARPGSGAFITASQVDGQARIVAYRKLGDLPVYVTAARTMAAVTGAWLSAMASYLMFGLPATACLFLLTLVAWRAARRESVALTLLREEMTRREAAEATMRQAQRMEAMGQLTGGVAHDFNNLLQVFSSFAAVLRNDPAGPRGQRALEGMERAIGRGESLTRQLLAFARRRSLSPVVVDMAEHLPKLADMLRHGLRGDITVRVEMAEGVGAINADLSELELAVLNLAVNARDAMPQGGTLTLTAANATLTPAPETNMLEGAFVALSVSDAGCGIPADIVPRIFEPFFTTKDTGKGTGLGLSQVYGFVRQTGGAVTVDSEPGRGTTVTLYFPRVAPPARTVEVETAPAAAAGRSDGRVLLVEDNPMVAEAATAVLTQLGYEVSAVEDAAAALAVLERGSGGFDLLFSDIVMPGGMSGLDLARVVRERWPGLPVLLTSAYSAVARQAAAEGLPILPKPYTMAEFEAAAADARARYAHQS